MTRCIFHICYVVTTIEHMQGLTVTVFAQSLLSSHLAFMENFTEHPNKQNIKSLVIITELEQIISANLLTSVMTRVVICAVKLSFLKNRLPVMQIIFPSKLVSSHIANDYIDYSYSNPFFYFLLTNHCFFYNKCCRTN